MSILNLGGSTLASKSGSTLSLDSGVTFPSDHIVQSNYTTYTWDSGDSSGVDGIEINQAFGAIHTFVPKYNNTKILFIMHVPEILAQNNYWGMGFCVTTNSGLTAGMGNNDPEGNHSATIYRDYSQRNVPGSAQPVLSITFKTISCSAGTTYYIAPILSNLTANTVDIYANWSGGNNRVQTQLIMEMSP
tara:strand:+ start:257 stop:823 length:567 start_codon:yes stop_codon:yes gene_type:complete